MYSTQCSACQQTFTLTVPSASGPPVASAFTSSACYRGDHQHSSEQAAKAADWLVLEPCATCQGEQEQPDEDQQEEQEQEQEDEEEQ